jgi:hypothetical protein
LCQTLYDRGLADSRVADQHRVVLRLAREDLNHAADLGVAADNRVELARRGVSDQVTPVLLQCFVRDLRHRRCDPLVAANAFERLEEPVAGDLLFTEESAARRSRSFVDQCKDQMLDADVLVLEPLGLALGSLEQRSQSSGDADLPGAGSWGGDAGASRQRRLDLGGELVGVCARLREQPGHEPVRLVEQCKEQMLAIHLGVAEAEGLGLGVVQGFLRLLCQPIRVHDEPSLGWGRRLPGAAASRTAMRSSRSATSPSPA